MKPAMRSDGRGQSDSALGETVALWTRFIVEAEEPRRRAHLVLKSARQRKLRDRGQRRREMQTTSELLRTKRDLRARPRDHAKAPRRRPYFFFETVTDRPLICQRWTREMCEEGRRTTDGLPPPAGGLGVLTPDPEPPEMPQTAVGADLLEPLEVVTELGVDAVGEDLVRLAVDNVLLPVEEPGGDLELGGVLQDRHDPL